MNLAGNTVSAWTAMHETWFGEPPAEGSADITPVEGFGESGFDDYVMDDHTFACG